MARHRHRSLFSSFPQVLLASGRQCFSPTVVALWKWLRVPSVVEWKSRFSITRCACSKYVGGAESAGWESPSEMESMDLKERQQSKGTGENL